MRALVGGMPGDCLGRLKALSLMLILTAAHVLGAGGEAYAQWRPARPVEMIVASKAGGAAVVTAQFIADIITRYKLSPVPMTVLPKPGGAGAEGYSHVIGTTDPDHTLLITGKTFYTVTLRQPELGFDIGLLAPIASLGNETFLLWVQGDRSDINGMPDFVNAVKEKKLKTGQSWTIAGMAKDSEDSLLCSFLNANYNLDMQYLALPGGADAARLLAEKKIDSTVNLPWEQTANFRGGKSKPLVAFSDKRLGGYQQVPTLVEKGEKFAIDMMRGVAGAPGMSPEAQQFYVEVFKKVYDSPEWQAYRTKNDIYGKFMTGPGLKEYWLRQLKLRRIMMSVMDVMQAPTR